MSFLASVSRQRRGIEVQKRSDMRGKMKAAQIRKVGVVLNPEKRDARKVLTELKAWLEERGLEVVDDLTLPRGEIPKNSDAIIVLGGDGTLLNLAKFMTEDSGPILGVNMGGLSFLTETTQKELYSTLEEMLAGECEISERMMLEAGLSGREEKYVALNDIVITKSAASRVLTLAVRIDGKDFISYLGDGIIISTPTGSTAHALAAGGPIVHPSVDSCIIIPLCPHTLASRPLVSPQDKEIKLSFGPEAEEIVMAVDGQRWVALGPKDVVKVVSSHVRIKLVTSTRRSYWQILREKLGLS